MASTRNSNTSFTEYPGERIAITFGDAGENHTGMEMLGDLKEKGTGFTVDDLKKVKEYYEDKGYECEYVCLNLDHDNLENTIIPEYIDAGVLIIRNYIDQKEQERIYTEVTANEWDAKYYDTRRNKVLNKHARSNLMFVRGMSQEPDYENKKGTIIDSAKLKYFNKFQTKIEKTLNKLCDNKASNLVGEGNRYISPNKNGVGWHGDSERTRVVCLSLGGEDYPMKWSWFHRYYPLQINPFEITLNSGDVYIMSEMAVGQEWKKPSLYTLRHAAGASKYTKYKKEWIDKLTCENECE